MAELKSFDAIVVGGGPNGLAAAITLAQTGKAVALYEANETVGGAVRSAPLTLPDFVHDVCSAVYPLAAGSPFFRTLPLAQYGLEWIHSPAPLAHPLDDGTAVMLERSIEATAEGLGEDGSAYRNLFDPLVNRWTGLDADILAPPHLPLRPKNLTNLVCFGLQALQPARRLAQARFRDVRARALFAGLAAHAMLPLEAYGAAAFGLVLGATAHAVGWPIARGGAQRLADALSAHFRSLGGKIFLNQRVRAVEDLPAARAVLCDLTPRQFLTVAGARLPARLRHQLKKFRYGMGAFKVDWALSAPVPWKARECRRAATVHLGGPLEEICASERAAWRGLPEPSPFVLVAQPSLFDGMRSPEGKHTLWAYCHVPNGSGLDMTAEIEAQIERFAPGFRDVILARHIMTPAELERRNPNLVGGDINGGAPILSQLLFRPSLRMYGTGVPGLYLCSSSTPPGGGVHGMCGYFAAQKALRECFK
jgi:phytoene dehydrogenase-like protein